MDGHVLRVIREQTMEIFNAIEKNINKRKMIYGSLVLFLFFWFGALEKPMPWKITDPSSARFSVERFRLTDYTSKMELQSVLETIFPLGTDKEYVDKILVETAKAKSFQLLLKHMPYNDKIGYNYSYNNIIRQKLRNLMPVAGPPDWSPSHELYISYDDNLKVKRVYVMTAV